jgi:hypothetical protein
VVHHHVKHALAAAGATVLVAVCLGKTVALPRRNVAPPALARQANLSRLRAGDLIFRIGRGWRANAVRWLGEGELSHVGIIDVGTDGVHVIHAAPPEGSSPGEVKRETLAAFEDDAASNGIVVYRRSNIDSATDSAITAKAREFARRRVPFDDAFDLRDSRAMYCTEMVWRASEVAGAGFKPVLTTVDMGMFKGKYMTPHDLIAALDLRRIE